MKTLQLNNQLYWVGMLDPDLRVFDILMNTEFGTTYNSYILKGSQKTVLFETAKWTFVEEYLKKVSSIVPPIAIDYIVVDHTEPDHAGSIMELITLNPNIQIVATATAIRYLKDQLNQAFNSIVVKDGDTLFLGDKTLRFISVPNLHWPDTMYTYIVEDATLVTCDSFGSHYAFAEVLRSKVKNEADYWQATQYYYDNIIGPFAPFMVKALDKIKALDIQMICTGHGPVLDSGIPEILDQYRTWATAIAPNAKKTVVIPYVSAYGYTQMLAQAIADGVRESGNVEVKLYDMVVSDVATVSSELTFADGILLGSPTILSEALKPIWELTLSMYPTTHSGKYASAFGSYGWSGEAVPHLLERLKQLRMKVVDGYTVKFKPSVEELQAAKQFGLAFGQLVLEK